MSSAVLHAGLHTTPLGYGCANLMGRLGKRESRRILDAAFDAGIRHFDVAPLYGYGECESLLGEFSQARRDRVTIATKFGIRPPKRSAALSAAKSAARAVVAIFPQLRKQIRRRAEQMTNAGCFTVEECERSLQNSLRELRTDYIDVFLMHEIAPGQISPELVAALEDTRHRGLIRHFGIATTAESTIAIRTSKVSAGEIAQFPSSIFANTLQFLPMRSSLACITHSALGSTFKDLIAKLKSDGDLRARWSRDLDFDCSDTSQLGALFLQAAMKQNSGGIVLFSSLNDRNIRRNGDLLTSAKFSEQQLSLATNLAFDVLGLAIPETSARTAAAAR